MVATSFSNPFRPGAGHPPPYLAGRDAEKREFQRLLGQDVVLENMVLTGLRGVGKTVLLDVLKPMAVTSGWYWVGTDLSESVSTSEESLSTRILADLAAVTSGFAVPAGSRRGIGFGGANEPLRATLDYPTLRAVHDRTPGLVADKLKAVLELAWACIAGTNRGLVFAYDEAQNLADKAEKDQYPLSLLLDVFQSLQKKGVRFMLVLVGLPTLFPKLVEARTFAERMFRVVFLNRLSVTESKSAIEKPIADAGSPVQLTVASVKTIVEYSGGYPYFIQFICREVFDIFVRAVQDGARAPRVPIDAILSKLDTDFFAGRWARVTDRQRDLLHVVASLDSCDDEFTVQEIAEKARELLDKPFSSSHINQMLAALSGSGLVYKNRHGKYAFAVPLFGRFVLRQRSA